MKKVLAVVLSLIMMFAVCVPAFAAEGKENTKIIINDNQPEIVDGKQTADSILKTSTQKEDGTEGATYTVSIPAETVIPWEKLKTGMQYSIVTQLEAGKRLSVEAESASGANELTRAGSTDKIPYTFSLTNGGGAVDTLSFTTDKEVFAMTRGFNIDITKDAWAAVPVAEYTGTLTFTVAIIDAPAA